MTKQNLKVYFENCKGKIFGITAVYTAIFDFLSFLFQTFLCIYQGANKIGRRNASDILGSCVMRFRPGAERC